MTVGSAEQLIQLDTDGAACVAVPPAPTVCGVSLEAFVEPTYYVG